MTVDQTQGTCIVYTYKAGVLSAVGHDLAIRCERFSIDIDLDDEVIEGRFDATQLTVLGAVKNGVIVDDVLSPKDTAEILANIRNYVLKNHQGAQIRFESDDLEIDDDTIEGDGTLTIPPRSHRVDFEADIEDGRAVCSIKLHQPDFGITPFSALMGALRIQPDILIEVDVPWPQS